MRKVDLGEALYRDSLRLIAEEIGVIGVLCLLHEWAGEDMPAGFADKVIDSSIKQLAEASE